MTSGLARVLSLAMRAPPESLPWIKSSMQTCPHGPVSRSTTSICTSLSLKGVTSKATGCSKLELLPVAERTTLPIYQQVDAGATRGPATRDHEPNEITLHLECRRQSAPGFTVDVPTMLTPSFSSKRILDVLEFGASPDRIFRVASNLSIHIP